MDDLHYPMSRDMYASMRQVSQESGLNLQHYLWKDALGYLLHPSIPIKHPKTMKIADLGTGTGIWLLDLSRSLEHSVQLDGFDISSAQYPNPQHLPNNVRLRELDCVQDDPPEDLHHQYDIVHIRLFIGVIRDRDPMGVLSHASKLLRPGGYIQWDECDVKRMTAIRPDGKPAPNGSEIATFMCQIAKTSQNDWPAALPTLFSAANLENVASESTREADWQRQIAAQNLCSVAEEIASTAFKDDAARAKKLRMTIEGAVAEVKAGARMSTPFYVAVGSKTGIRCTAVSPDGER